MKAEPSELQKLQWRDELATWLYDRIVDVQGETRGQRRKRALKIAAEHFKLPALDSLSSPPGQETVEACRAVYMEASFARDRDNSNPHIGIVPSLKEYVSQAFARLVDSRCREAVRVERARVFRERTHEEADAYILGVEDAAALHESVNPASDDERIKGHPGAGAMGAVIEYRDKIRGLLEVRSVKSRESK